MPESATPAAEPAETGPESPVDATESTGWGDDTGERPEDVKWRQRFRQAEARLTVEQARVSELNRKEAERLAAVVLQDPADLWLDGATPADVLGADGLVDPELVEAKAQATAEAHPHWRRTKPVVGAPAAAVTSDGTIPFGPQTPSWADLLGGQSAG